MMYDFSCVRPLPIDENELELLFYPDGKITGHIHPVRGWDDPVEGWTHLGPGADECNISVILGHESLHGLLHEMMGESTSDRLHRIREGCHL